MFLGIPLPIVGFVCFIIAAIFIFVRPQSGPTSGFWTNYILRWFHPLAWALLALAAMYYKASPILTGVLILAGLGVYTAFLVFFVREKGESK